MAIALSTAWAAVRTRVAAAAVRAGREPSEVAVVAASKGVGAEVLRAAAALGIRRFGENYVQEWQAKRAALAEAGALEWHFIGRVQRNKAAALAGCALVHSIADPRVAAILDREGRSGEAPVRVLVQVNLAGESTKAGIAAAALPRVLDDLRARPGLEVVGLMTMPPAGGPEDARPFFRALRELRDRQVAPDTLPQLSMGMSGDFEAAIEEGATLVRIGTALFGPRKEAP
jgi:pyridoxal phosphate enzyme (YggS family)